LPTILISLSRFSISLLQNGGAFKKNILRVQPLPHKASTGWAITFIPIN
jgi:hypothetical protein